MKILHITATHLHPAGGIPVVLKELAQAQNQIDDMESRVLSVRSTVNEIGSPYFDYIDTNSFSEYLTSYMPDIVIFHSHYYIEYISLYRTVKKEGIPYFIQPHGSFGKAALSKSKIKKAIVNNSILRSLLKNATGYVFLNESEERDSHYKKKMM